MSDCFSFLFLKKYFLLFIHVSLLQYFLDKRCGRDVHDLEVLCKCGEQLPLAHWEVSTAPATATILQLSVQGKGGGGGGGGLGYSSNLGVSLACSNDLCITLTYSSNLCISIAYSSNFIVN